MHVLVTGSTGFVGKALVNELLLNNHQVKALVRQPSKGLPLEVQQILLKDLSALLIEDLIEDSANRVLTALKGVDTVIHTAARVHVMKERAVAPLEAFRKVNRDATLALAELAAQAGVKRFVFLSSIKVNGETSLPNQPFTPDDRCGPLDPYGLSKYEAEQGLQRLASQTGMELVIIRPPLIYGPGVKANFASIMQWMAKPVPLPFGAIHNQRSLVALDNLVDFIRLCADREDSPKAAGHLFLISDGDDVSTTQLLKSVRHALKEAGRTKVHAWLVPVPVSVMLLVAKLLGKQDVANRLFGSLQLDASKTYSLLGWHPKVSMAQQLAKMVVDP